MKKVGRLGVGWGVGESEVIVVREKVCRVYLEKTEGVHDNPLAVVEVIQC